MTRWVYIAGRLWGRVQAAWHHGKRSGFHDVEHAKHAQAALPAMREGTPLW